MPCDDADVAPCMPPQTFPFLIILPLAEKIFASGWDITTAGIGPEIMGSPLFWLQLILIYLFAFGSRCAGAVVCDQPCAFGAY